MPIDTFDPAAHDEPAPVAVAAPEPVAEPEAEGAVGQLRAYEDHLFGEDCVRINGKIERGIGSKFQHMTDAQARHYAAIEKAIAAEQAVSEANAALLVAQDAHEAAVAEVAASEDEAHATADK